jgi:hypothetical protein
MECDGGSGSENCGDEECREVQHGDHEEPPGLQTTTGHPAGQPCSIENKQFMAIHGGAICGLKNTPWLA